MLHGNTAASCHVVVLMGEGDERCSLCGTVSHGDRESDADKEVLYLLVERSSTDNYLVWVLTKLTQHELANLLLDALADDRHAHQKLCAVGLDMWEHFLSYDLIHHERYSEENVGLDFCQRL